MSWPWRPNRAIVLGFYQNRRAVRPVIPALRRGRFYRSAEIHISHDGEVSGANWVGSSRLAILTGLAVAVVLVVVDRLFEPGLSTSDFWTHVLAGLAGGFLGGWSLAKVYEIVSAILITKQYRKWVNPGESLVLVGCNPDDAATVAEILSEGEGEHAAVFVLQPGFGPTGGPPVATLGTPMSEENLSLRAAELGKELRNPLPRGAHKRPLMGRLNACEAAVRAVHRRLSDAVRLDQSIALSAEWLLDNAYVIQGHVEDFRRNLPTGFYRELPFMAEGSWAGYPRTYAIAAEMVGDSDAHLTKDSIQSFLQSFQTEVTLTTGELWALPMLLRLRLIECLTSLSVQVERRQRESGLAAFYANRLLYTGRRAPARIPEILTAINSECRDPSSCMVEEVVGQLYDDERALSTVRTWLQGKLPGPIEDVIRREQHLQSSEQVSLANAITTLRLLSQLDWRSVFESVSRVEARLWTDPAKIYSRMDFATRDRYRHVVEGISRRGKIPEEDVAQAAIDLAEQTETNPQGHVGYFLVDDGRTQLEQRVKVRPTIPQRCRRWIKRHAALVYVGSVSVATVSIVALLVGLTAVPVRSATAWILVLLGVLPASDLAVQVVNYLLTRSIRPEPLPKMFFDQGIPDDCRSLVVVPMMLLTPESIEREIERLEIRALANPDENLVFGLLSDYSDAPLQHMPEDLELLDVAAKGIQGLNARYGSSRFFLFHRERTWSEGERLWMGWERKRGKLEQLNALLVEPNRSDQPVQIRVGEAARLEGIRFVITLDSDTQLPRDTAHRLIATLAHPLNQPILSEDRRRVLRGYSIIQPRVSTSLPSATSSLFTRLFTDPTGVDPYTHAVSDVYQDLSGVANYHGKGIYDLRAFHDVLAGRFPEEHLLSHDLIEGAHVRVGLASDIELLDLFPSDYGVFCSRAHRWIRGDWQIADWLLPTVPVGHGRGRNPLPALERWKIFDNLRRSLVPAATVALLVVGCAVSPEPILCALLVVAIVLAPMAFQLLSRLTAPWKLDPMVWREPGLNLARSVLFAGLLPHQAALDLDAIVRVIYRRTFTHRLLLEWTVSRDLPRRTTWSQKRRILLGMAWVPLFAAGVAYLMFLSHRQAAYVTLPFAALWAVSPFAVTWLDEPIHEKPARDLSPSERAMLRRLARETWRFFDQFVGPDTHWLPPDNFQQMLRVELAERTSPTNIGLYLISILGAHDLGYIPPGRVIERVLATMQTLTKLEKYQGHLLNWYETRTLTPLGDRYVSTVDSGNLMGSLWALHQGLDELLDQPALGLQVLQGLSDCWSLSANHVHGVARIGLTRPPGETEIGRLLDVPATRLEEVVERLDQLRAVVPKVTAPESAAGEVQDVRSYWKSQLDTQLEAFRTCVERFLPWVRVLSAPPMGGLLQLGQHAHGYRRNALARAPSLRAIAAGTVPGLSDLLALRLQSRPEPLPDDLRQWLDHLAEKASSAQEAAKVAIESAEAALGLVRSLDREMKMEFLYDPNRRLFAIGYNVAERRLDQSYYDLLASEARLASFVAIARGEIETEHWWTLGRPYGQVGIRRPLLSWNGTMFEYLMPLLLTKSYANSMLDQACKTAVDCQIRYARDRGIPWGISEAAYSAIDSRQIYQYRAFGVPDLALKRGLERDFVVAPYATVLALAVDRKVAAQNIRRLGAMGPLTMRGDFGFYESIDYTRQHRPQGERGLIVHAFMAHHQGMILLAIANALSGDSMRRRFHADPRVRATESLLYERVPVAPPLFKSYTRDAPIARLSPVVSVPVPGRVDTPDTPVPITFLLSNGSYAVMVTNAGGGYSRWRNFDISRWRADTTKDGYGSFCYLKDMETGFVWSNTHQPVGKRAHTYHAVFNAEKAEFRRREAGIETITEVVVSPEDNAEVRRITLINRSHRPRRVELTSYVELALAPHAADRTHPVFSKMFVQTEMLRDLDALLAWRRPRSPQDPPIWTAHVIATAERLDEPQQFDTDRRSFIGRGRSLRSPRAVDEPLSGQSGFVLDPIFSLRRQILIQPNERVQIAFTTLAAETREQAITLAAKYCDLQAAQRAMDLAWTHAQLELRHLRIQPDEAQIYQRLAGHVIYPHAHLRAPEERVTSNELGQQRLWAYGISGDLPIVVVTIDERQHIDLVHDVLAAHSFWRSRGLVCDLVILNEEAASYENPLQAELQRLVMARSQNAGLDCPGGIFLRPAGQIPQEDRNLILAAARVVLVAARGSLARQVAAPFSERLRHPKPVHATADEEASVPLPFVELDFHNGLGGFGKNGRDYFIHLNEGEQTPAPWINVLANPTFGCLVSEQGAGVTWNGNSQSNRLTPWSNDPVQDPPSDAIYLYDRDLDALWTPTPLPIRENDPYQIRHGQGYSVHHHSSHAIEQELTSFVPVDSDGGLPVKVEKLRLVNQSSRRRALTVTFYAEWILGTVREETQLYVVTKYDVESESIFARNAYAPDYSKQVAFVACSASPSSYTADRAEVLGRNGDMANPIGLRRSGLAKRAGSELDPCAALQCQVVLEPGGEEEIVFFIGQAGSEEAARDLIRRLRRPREEDRLLRVGAEYWDRMLGAIQVETPDRSVDLLLNRWLLYQVLACRYWGRTAFYQSGGAFGFRDQLQDVLALVYTAPEITRSQILRSAARQFAEGDVQHWWHPQSGAGVRTRISDDLLWMPFAVADYCRITGDYGILDETVSFLSGEPLDKDEQESYSVPGVDGTGSLLDHCKRAIAKSNTVGPHALPLIGGGDWNDGLNRVGAGGKGESIWLAWFQIRVLRDFGDILRKKSDVKGATEYESRAADLAKTIDATSWDGRWYRRAYFDDGMPLGSEANPEARIDSLSQSWSVIAGGGSLERAQTAMQSADEMLVDEKNRLVLLFAPPFDNWPVQPGYIKGYPPGVRENGGQYTHGSLWMPMAWARLGKGGEAVRLLQLMNPIGLGEKPERYRVEPYVVAADVYSLAGHVGMGGWTWYTGSAGWMYRIWVEEVLGLRVRANSLSLSPVIPKSWPGFKLTYRHGQALYLIEVDNAAQVESGVARLELDGQAVDEVLLEDSGEHRVKVVLGLKKP